MKYLCLFIPLLIIQSVFAQTKLPVIKATSKSVAINDGGYLDKNAWSLSPKARPDIFTADRTRKTKWVTFYTDIDSIRVKVKPGTKFNFIVLLNGKDSCYIQIASAIPAEVKPKGDLAKNDTIPFTLTSFNAIMVKAVMNNTDTLKLHFDISSFDVHLTRDAILKRTSLLSNQPDAIAGKAKPDYNNLSKVFKLQMGSLIVNDPPVLPTVITADEMDGRFGWNLFEGKQIKVDYDHNRLIVYGKMPRLPIGYVRTKIEFVRSEVCIKGTFKIENKKYTGFFAMDTGSALAAILDSGWMAKQNFPKNLKLIKASLLSDPRGVKYQIKIVSTPQFNIGEFAFTDIPTLLLNTKRNPSGFEVNYLGNDLLKRFNMILDFKNDYLYLQPNKLTGVKFRATS
jgi:hypothetical protein